MLKAANFGVRLLILIALAPQTDAITGEWRGRSTCVNLTLAPACKEELTRYTFTTTASGLHLSADKIVAGRYESMGDMDLVAANGAWQFDFAPRNGSPGRWIFRAVGQRLSGELIQVTDGARIRLVEAARPLAPAEPRRTRINRRDGAELAEIPSGAFVMGSDASELRELWRMFGWDPSELEFTTTEQPARRVDVAGFWMYRTLVTVAQFRAFASATGRAMPPAPPYGWADDRPVVNETWAEADAYCTYAGGRLPTETQWEYAARAGRTGVDGMPRTVFVWGDHLPDAGERVGNLADETFKRSEYYSAAFHHFAGYDDGAVTATAVRAFPPNGFGLFDMAGNVLEWCADWYDTAHTRRSLRGGAFDTTPTITRVSRRLGNDPTVRHVEKGFRCVAD